VGPLTDQAIPYAEEEGKYAKYQHLRANVRRRRQAYGWFIVLAILVFIASIVDILFFREETWNADKVAVAGTELGLVETIVYALYAVLFVWGIFLLISRRRHKAELAAIADLERQLFACPDCNAIMELGLAKPGEKTVAMSCPNCGRFNRFNPDTKQVWHAEAPAGRPREIRMECSKCEEEIGVGMYGRNPGPVQFRACPHCGSTGTVQPRKASASPA
jgi:uncharacterized membrane protein YhaH (DUF805 family)